VSDFFRHLRPSDSVRARSPSPEQSVTGAMPGDYRFRLDENESFGPVVPNAPNDNPEQPIELIQLGARLFPFVNGQLLTKSGGLHCQTVPRHEKRPHVRQHARQKSNHHSDATQQSLYSLWPHSEAVDSRGHRRFDDRLAALELRPFKQRFSVAPVLRMRYGDGFFTVNQTEAQKSVNERLCDLLKQNPGITKSDFESIATDRGLGRNCGREFLDSGVRGETIRVELGTNNRQLHSWAGKPIDFDREMDDDTRGD
jgi:hypothetical protein